MSSPSVPSWCHRSLGQFVQLEVEVQVLISISQAETIAMTHFSKLKVLPVYILEPSSFCKILMQRTEQLRFMSGMISKPMFSFTRLM